MFLLSALSAVSKKETNSLRPLRLSGDYKLSNYNTIPYLRIRVLRETENSKIPFTAESTEDTEKSYFCLNLCDLSVLRGENPSTKTVYLKILTP